MGDPVQGSPGESRTKDGVCLEEGDPLCPKPRKGMDGPTLEAACSGKPTLNSRSVGALEPALRTGLIYPF